MSEIICPQCHAQSPDSAFYCYRCAQPLVCKNCKTLLVSEARACSQCGQLIPERSNNEQRYTGIVATTLPGYSHVKWDETLTERHLDAMIDNNAIGQLLPLLVGSRPLGQFKSAVDSQAQQTALVEVDAETPPSQPQLPAATQSPHPTTEPPAEQRIWEVFRERDGRLMQEIVELKAVPLNKKSYVIRLVSLYLYANELKGEERVPREEVFRVLDEANVKDTNTSRYIYGAGIRLDEETETMRLTLESRTKAQQYLAEIFDPDVPDGWRPGSSTHPANGRAKKQTKRSGERHNESDTLVAEWVAREKIQELNQEFPQNITGTFSVEDKALFGLYCLDKAGVTVEIQPTQLSKYLYTAFQLNVPADSIRFRKALKNKPPYVARKEDSGSYRITPAGIAHVERLLQSSKQ